MAASQSTALTAQDSPRRHRAALRAWLWILVGLVIVMVALGGATRLTGSGLSITEWRPVTGAVPPLSEADWIVEFEKYRGTPQYRILNEGLGLRAFKTLYWWEWAHRLFGRVIGLAFFLPLIVFWWRGVLDRRLGLALLGLGLLGGLQGAVGWIMVASGLEPGMTAVAPLKLSLHLTIASLILAGLVWLAAGLGRRADEAPPAMRRTALALMGLLLVQIALGGLVAGAKAGLVHNTWPGMDGVLIPSYETLFAVRPWIENFVDNHTLVQFNHRIVAYLLVVLALLHALEAWARAPSLAPRVFAIAGLTLAQAALGVATLLLRVPLAAALAHQVLAMVLLIAVVAHARLSRGGETRAWPAEPATPFGFEGLAGREADGAAAGSRWPRALPRVP